MPRKASPKSCLTCRKRKVKCDEHLPRCMHCQKAQLHCDRSSELAVKQFKKPGKQVAHEPQELLKQPHIAALFQIYIKELAPWYDLNDESRTFAREGAARALSSPLLFAAAIALAGLYSSRKFSSSPELADIYHARCLTYLIEIKAEDEAVRDGTALAATCLLRSYEILSEENDPNRHLFGASTLLPQQPLTLPQRSLLAAGFWNFLREDITYSLIHQCPLKVGVDRVYATSMKDHDLANAVTLLLAQAVNLYFSCSFEMAQLEVLQKDLEIWQQAFTVRPFASFDDSATTFPSLMMLEDTYVAAMHYLLVIQCMFPTPRADRAMLAAKICGLAMSSSSDAVIVNAYGPICFTARWLSLETQKSELLKWLQTSKRSTAWGVDAIVQQLQLAWTEDMVS